MPCGTRADIVANEGNTMITRVVPSGDFIAISQRSGGQSQKANRSPRGRSRHLRGAAQGPAALGHWPAAQMPSSLSLRSRLPILSRIPPAAMHLIPVDQNEFRFSDCCKSSGRKDAPCSAKVASRGHSWPFFFFSLFFPWFLHHVPVLKHQVPYYKTACWVMEFRARQIE
jgi:hypothetical protein